MELTPNWIADWYSPFRGLFYCFPINQFSALIECTDKRGKKNNQIAGRRTQSARGEMCACVCCVLPTSAHIRFAQKAKGLIWPMYSMELSASPLNNKHRQMDATHVRTSRFMQNVNRISHYFILCWLLECRLRACFCLCVSCVGRGMPRRVKFYFDGDERTVDAEWNIIFIVDADVIVIRCHTLCSCG